MGMPNQARTKRYKVWADRPRYFDSLNDALALADKVYARTGNIVAITEVWV